MFDASTLFMLIVFVPIALGMFGILTGRSSGE